MNQELKTSRNPPRSRNEEECKNKNYLKFKRDNITDIICENPYTSKNEINRITFELWKNSKNKKIHKIYEDKNSLLKSCVSKRLLESLDKLKYQQIDVKDILIELKTYTDVYLELSR